MDKQPWTENLQTAENHIGMRVPKKVPTMDLRRDRR